MFVKPQTMLSHAFPPTKPWPEASRWRQLSSGVGVLAPQLLSLQHVGPAGFVFVLPHQRDGSAHGAGAGAVAARGVDRDQPIVDEQ